MGRWLLFLGFLLCAFGDYACSASCIDHDGDGFGEGCQRGPDCDDDDPSVAASCTELAQRCAQDEFAKGCPCYAGITQQCYSGPEQTVGVGGCRAGRHSCPAGQWTGCVGEVLPAAEVCNDQDDDCDGNVDEGAVSPCGGCDSACLGGVWGPPAAPFEASGDLAVDDIGEMTLAFSASASHTVWVPNTGEGTLSKIDSDRAREVARYRVAGDTPERVAVDHDGDAWVLSPSLDGASLLTKVAAGIDRCRDRDGNGVQTSHGPTQLLPAGADECVLLQQPVGKPGEVARSLAIDGTRAPDRDLGGNLWVGMQHGQRLLELDGNTAQPLREVATPGLSTLDSVFDPWGTLWLIDRAGLLARVDPSMADPKLEIVEAPLRCYEFDSLASDAQGVLTLTGFSCEDVIVYDARHNTWHEAKTQGVLDTRGVTVLGEQSWVVHTAGRLSRVRRDPLAILDTFELRGAGISPLESTAIGADSSGLLWVVSSMGAPAGNGVLSCFDPEQTRVTAQVPLGQLPRPRGDITGSRLLGEFAPQASARHVFAGCDGATEWLRLHLEWSAGQGASVEVSARRAAAREALDGTDFVALGTLPKDPPPYALHFDAGGVVEVQLILRVAGRIGAPRIGRVGLEWQCPGPD
jgi:streptogramin lyase